ncbi:hypothetical protein GCM10020331_096770 [Ectobacillus funiculus]
MNYRYIPGLYTLKKLFGMSNDQKKISLDERNEEDVMDATKSWALPYNVMY